MYAVIFSAEIARLDDAYATAAQRLRDLAMERYGCRAFTSCTEAGREIAVSYWDSEDQILAWKRDPEHLEAQKAGQSHWYSSYSVQVARIVRGYTS